MVSSDQLSLLPPALVHWAEEVVVSSDQLWVVFLLWAISHPVEVACSLEALAEPLGCSWTMDVGSLTEAKVLACSPPEETSRSVSALVLEWLNRLDQP